MLELNRFFFVHLINFLVLIALLNYILFKPLLRTLTEREGLIKGSLDSAKAMDVEKENQLRELEEKLAEARDKAKTIFEGMSREGLALQKESVEKTQKDAAELTRKAREDLQREVKKTKESMKREIEVFSKMIVEKLVGV
ncbi:MAG: ATP synthase F0 subunit B [Thermodesulfovibrionia bacterium]|nr:ATP synthase F0 subunit B [Thermodesulfovibrionia bacterium]